MMKNYSGISLVMATVMILIVFFLSMVSLAMVTSNANQTRAIYSQSLNLMMVEDGPFACAEVLLEDAEDGFMNHLDTSVNQGKPFYSTKINYAMFGDVNVDVFVRNNVEADNTDLAVDNDDYLILTTEAYIEDASGNRLSQTSLEVLVKYLGNDDAYTQESDSATGNSDFRSEKDISSVGTIVVD